MTTFIDRIFHTKRTNTQPNENDSFESFHSVFKPSKPENFIVLTPVSKTHLRTELFGESPGKIALEEGIKKSQEGKFESAKYLYEVAAAHGEVMAVHNLATMYLHGQGTPKDLNLAWNYFVKCAADGYPLSMSQLGYMYLYGRGVDVDYRKAREWFTRANEAGNEPYAQFCLGVIFINGYGVKVDIPRGLAWLYKSAKNHFIPALYNLGVFAENGENGMHADWNDALTFYEEAASYHTDEYSMNNLGALYCKAGKKQKTAVELFELAAERGLSQATFNLGEAYMHGIGVQRDPIKAAKFYYKAAKQQTNSAAEYALAVIFYNGIDKKIQPNLEVAKYWLEQASNHGHTLARRSLQMMKPDKQNKTDT